MKVDVDHRGMAWTLQSPLPIEEVWVSSMIFGVVKGWHGDNKICRTLYCLQGKIWQSFGVNHRKATYLVPGGEGVTIMTGFISAVVALEPSLLLYLQDGAIDVAQPITVPITEKERRFFPIEADWNSLSTRDRS